MDSTFQWENLSSTIIGEGRGRALKSKLEWLGVGHFDLLREPISFPELPLGPGCSPSSRGLLGLARGHVVSAGSDHVGEPIESNT